MKDKHQQEEYEAKLKFAREQKEIFQNNQKQIMHSLRDEKNPVKTDVKAESKNVTNEIIADYKAFMQKLGVSDIKPPQNTENRLSLSFSKPEHAFDFFTKQALKHDLLIVDANSGQLLAYSENGKLFHGNGEPALKSPLSTDKAISMEEFNKKQKEPEQEEAKSKAPGYK